MSSCEHIVDDPDTEEEPEARGRWLSMPGARAAADNMLERRESIALASYERLLKDARARFAAEEDEEGDALRRSWTRACGFLEDNQKRALIQSRGRSPLPTVSRNPDGSLDLFWSEGSFTLLVNVPPGEETMIEYSGEAEGYDPVIGKMERPSCEPRIVDLLKG